jgi:hypothetical protein
VAEGKSKTLWIVLGVLGGLALLCCGGFAVLGIGGFSAVMDAGEQADPIVTEFLEHLSAEEYEAAYALTSPGFQENNGQEVLVGIGSQISGAMGAFQSVTRTGLSMSSNSGVVIGNTDPDFVPGTSAKCTYQGTYEKGPVTVTVTLQQQPDDSWQIWGFNVLPD